MDTDGPPNSRLFLVCGKHATEELLAEAFQQFGRVQSVKLIRDKGVAYIKYDKASSAAAAQEALHEAVLNDGRTKLKVMLAEAPNARRHRYPRTGSDAEAAADPDNVPPRSRLFIVVPKTADAALIQEELGRWPDLQYCKTDLIASKGVVFCKFMRSSPALSALEAIVESGTLAGYKVKCMLAEPKSGRGRPDSGSGSLDNTWQVDRGAAASPSTSGSRGGAMCGGGNTEHSAATRAGIAGSHGMSPAHSRSLNSMYSDGAVNHSNRALPAIQSIGYNGPLGEPYHNSQDIIAQIGLAALANFAQGAVSGGVQIAGSQSYPSQNHDVLQSQNPPNLGTSQQVFAQQALSGGNSGCTTTPGIAHQQAYTLAMHMQQQQQQQHHLQQHHQQQQQQHHQQQQRLGVLPGAHSDGSLNNLAAQVGLGSAAGLGLGLGLGIGAGSALHNSRGLENLSLGSLIASIQQPPSHQREVGGSHAADISSGGSMSVCTNSASGLRSSEAFNRQRLFVVCHKAATEDMLARLFRMWPDLEYLDLKRDHSTGASKGFCYVNYSSKEAAAAAMDILNGIEWPPASGTRLKVMYAEPQASRRPPLSGAVAPRHVPSDSLESAAHAVTSPQRDDETSSRHRPLPPPQDLGALSSSRLPRPSSIEEMGRGVLGNEFGGAGEDDGTDAPLDGHIAVHVASAGIPDHDAAPTEPGLTDLGVSVLHPSTADAMHHSQQQQQQLFSRQGSGGDGSEWGPDHGTVGQAGCLDRMHQAASQQQHQGDMQALQQAVSRQAHLAHMQQQLHHAAMQGPTPEQQQASQGSQLLPVLLQKQQPQVVADHSEAAIKTGRKQPAAAPAASDMNWESPQPAGAEAQRVYTTLPRPLPDYALQHVFEQFGTVEFVRLQSDQRHGVVQFAVAESAAAALKGLAGASITGLALTLSATDPLQPERNSKRPRVAT